MDMVIHQQMDGLAGLQLGLPAKEKRSNAGPGDSLATVSGWPVVSPRGWYFCAGPPERKAQMLVGTHALWHNHLLTRIAGLGPKDHYKRYYPKDGSGMWFHGTQGANTWRVEARVVAETRGWTCFLRACLEILTELDFARLVRHLTANAPRLLAGGVTSAAALALINGMNPPLPIALVVYNFSGRPLLQTAGWAGMYGVALVLVDDDGIVAPHWLPFHNLNAFGRIPYSDEEIVRGQQHPNPLIAQLALATPLANPGFFPLGVPLAPQLQEAVIFDFTDIYCFVGITAPPYDATKEATFFERTRRFWRLSGNQSSPTIVSIDGEPDLFDLTNAMLDDIGCCWELRPEVVHKMKVGLDTAVYWLDGPVSAADNKMLTTGAYNPDVLVALEANQSHWRLGPRQLVRCGERKYWISKLERAQWTFLGRFVYNFGLTEKIIKVSFLEDAMSALPSEKDFPTTAAFIRALYTKFAKLVPPEDVGPLLDQRNALLAYMSENDGALPPGFSPEANVRALLGLGRVLRQRLGDASANIEAFTVA